MTTSCAAQPGALDARDYEGCASSSAAGDICGDGPTVCRLVEALDDATFCTMPCERESDCEPLAGRELRCIDVGGEGTCAVGCEADDDCPWTTVCAYAEDGLRGICLPD